MKRRLSLALIVCMLVMLAACGSNPGSVPAASEAPAAEVTEPAAAPETPEAPAQPEEPAPAPAEPAPFQTSAEIEETVLVDESSIRITATELRFNSYSAELSLILENNTDKELTFISGSVGYSCNAVNGYMVSDGYMNETVTPGNKAMASVDFSLDELRLYGITGIADIQLGFDVNDADYDDYYQSGPVQVKTSTAASYDYSVDSYRDAIRDPACGNKYGYTVDWFADDVLYEQGGIRITSEALLTNSEGRSFFAVEAENTGDAQVYCLVRDVALNGLAVTGGTWSSESINPGTRRIILLDPSDMMEEEFREIFALDPIGSISFGLTVADREYKELYAAQRLTLTVPGIEAGFDGTGEELYSDGSYRIVLKSIEPDPFDLSDDIHVLLCFENGSDAEVTVTDAYDTLSVNGFMVSGLLYSVNVAPGASGFMDMELQDYALEEIGVTAIEDITEVAFGLEVRDSSYHELASPSVRISR